MGIAELKEAALRPNPEARAYLARELLASLDDLDEAEIEKLWEHALRIIRFGQAGDGNVHVTVLKDRIPDPQWDELIPQIEEKTYRLTLSSGGTITGEHGIDCTRRRYRPLALDPAPITLMRSLKSVFDPQYILNPSKVRP